VKLLVDMNLSPHWVDRLNAAGLPAVHWSRVGRMDAADIEIMAYASGSSRSTSPAVDAPEFPISTLVIMITGDDGATPRMYVPVTTRSWGVKRGEKKRD